MKSILETCSPRKSIIQGTFNPEIFTANLAPVIQFYKGENSAIDAIYTDADAFFKEATFPTHGLVQTVNNVFKRLAGDASVPTIQRLETAFGGGKTHTLISCVHIAYKGKEIAESTKGIIDKAYLPDPGSVIVVGIAGDEIPVNKTKGDLLIPYTLWGEVAYQVGGKELYNQVKSDAESFASPGKPFFDTVLKGKKVLIMLDELAHYAARLAAAHSNGSDQLAAFLMSLIEYAKATTGIAIVVTLASATDAFSRETEKLTELLNKAGTGGMTKDDAVTVAEGATKAISSVIRRNETTVTPVDSNEVSKVLAKRLFDEIDTVAAHETAEEYVEMYRKNASAFPEEATNVDFRQRMVDMYPFHPTLISFLNTKLSQAENFQGTRGVLRTLALTVRSIWEKKTNLEMIHVSDIDMANSQIADEILGRTSSAELRVILAADIGSADSCDLQFGMSNAQKADLKNPHPDGIKMYEKTWRMVFLNSLVGRVEKASNVFGVSQKEAIFQVATPIFVPSQVNTALEEISQSAYYLRYEDGKYFAHLDPTINSVLANIRNTIDDRQIRQKLKAVANDIVADNITFHIEKDVRYPQDISDDQEKPTVAIIALDADPISIKEMFTTKGDGIPRIRQNLVLLLVPKTVETDETSEVVSFFSVTKKSDEAKKNLEVIARQVLAIKALEENPSAYGISSLKLQTPEFNENKNERNLALSTMVNQMYTSFFFCGPNGFERRELRTAAGESGATLLNQVEAALVEAGELVKPSGNRYGSAALQALSKDYFFNTTDKETCRKLLDNFYNQRRWPMLPNKSSLETILREGIESGIWAAYKMSDNIVDDIPNEFFSQEKPLPLNVSLLEGNYSIMTVEGARKRGWTDSNKVSDEKVQTAIKVFLQSSQGVALYENLIEAVKAQYSNAGDSQIDDQLRNLMQNNVCGVYIGSLNQNNVPDSIVDGFSASNHAFDAKEVIITKQAQIERGWTNSSRRAYRMSGNDAARKIVPILRRIGSLYTRNGAKCVIDSLDITDMKLPSGAHLRLGLEDASPDDIKRLDELFQSFCDVAKVTDDTEADITINNPEEDCAFLKELKK